MDTYFTISVISQDTDMTNRVQACAATQGVEDGWAWANRWRWAAQPGWAAAWDSAVAAGVERPGRDPAVITDAQILSGVQALLAK